MNDGFYVRRRTIREALQALSTKERLAIALGATVQDVEKYLAGAPAPDKVFLDALDIVFQWQIATGAMRVPVKGGSSERSP
jgi:hypothetical protein